MCKQALVLAQVCEAAAVAERASEALLLAWPRLALRFGRPKAALAAAAKAAALMPSSSGLWRQRLVLETEHASFQVLRHALLPHCLRETHH